MVDNMEYLEDGDLLDGSFKAGSVAGRIFYRPMIQALLICHPFDYLGS